MHKSWFQSISSLHLMFHGLWWSNKIQHVFWTHVTRGFFKLRVCFSFFLLQNHMVSLYNVTKYANDVTVFIHQVVRRLTHRSRGILRRHEILYRDTWSYKLLCDKTAKLREEIRHFWLELIWLNYRQVSNISRTLVGNKIVDHSDVVGASPVGAAPTTSSFST